MYMYDIDYMTKGNRTGLILKSDEIVKIDTREEAHVQTATKVTMLQEEERQYQKAKEEVEKSCEHWICDKCKHECKEDGITGCTRYKTKQQEDKPKSCVYVCKECLGSEPCKLKSIWLYSTSEYLSFRKSRKANWKLKKECA